MKVLRILLRAIAFVQWLAAIALGVGSVVLQVQALEELGGVPGPEALGDMGDILGAIGPLVLSLNVTLPGLLLSILLMLSAIYCDRAAGTPRHP